MFRGSNRLDALQEENQRLTRRLCELELNEQKRALELQSLRLGVVILIGQLRAAGIEPAWEPATLDIPGNGQAVESAEGGP